MTTDTEKLLHKYAEACHERFNTDAVETYETFSATVDDVIIDFFLWCADEEAWRDS